MWKPTCFNWHAMRLSTLVQTRLWRGSRKSLERAPLNFTNAGPESIAMCGNILEVFVTLKAKRMRTPCYGCAQKWRKLKWKQCPVAWIYAITNANGLCQISISCVSKYAYIFASFAPIRSARLSALLSNTFQIDSRLSEVDEKISRAKTRALDETPKTGRFA